MQAHYTGRAKVLMSRLYIDSSEAVELLGQLIDYHEFGPDDLCAALAKHGSLPTYYKGELLDQPRYCIVRQRSKDRQAVFVGHFDESDTEESVPVYFEPEQIERLADIINGTGQPEVDAAEVEQLRQRIAELEAENVELKGKGSPANSALLLIGRALELYQRGEPRRYTQTRYTDELLEAMPAWGCNKTTINTLLADAKKALSEARNT